MGVSAYRLSLDTTKPAPETVGAGFYVAITNHTGTTPCDTPTIPHKGICQVNHAPNLACLRIIYAGQRVACSEFP